jgi:hypothetical protein
VALRATPKEIATRAPAAQTPRETNAITSRLALLYAERVGGPDAVDEVLARCGHERPALDLNIGRGLKLALRALGSPRLVYQNIVRANAKFSGSHTMELLDFGARHALSATRDRGRAALRDEARASRRRPGAHPLRALAEASASRSAIADPGHPIGGPILHRSQGRPFIRTTVRPGDCVAATR